MLLGILMALQYRYAFLLLAIAIPVQIFRAHQEAKVLEARFGDEYRRYRKEPGFSGLDPAISNLERASAKQLSGPVQRRTREPGVEHEPQYF